MAKNKTIKYNIELISTKSSMEDMSYIHEQIVLLIDSISDMIEEFDINISGNKEDIIKELDIKTNNVKKKFYDEKEFNKYINKFPKYYKKDESKAIYYIKDYLIKNRSARLIDIVKGCEEQGFESRSQKPSPAFYLRLKKLIDSGKVTKEDKVYFWNYEEDI